MIKCSKQGNLLNYLVNYLVLLWNWIRLMLGWGIILNTTGR